MQVPAQVQVQVLLGGVQRSLQVQVQVQGGGHVQVQVLVQGQVQVQKQVHALTLLQGCLASFSLALPSSSA